VSARILGKAIHTPIVPQLIDDLSHSSDNYLTGLNLRRTSFASPDLPRKVLAAVDLRGCLIHLLV
jgi:hypothetical protein